MLPHHAMYTLYSTVFAFLCCININNNNNNSNNNSQNVQNFFTMEIGMEKGRRRTTGGAKEKEKN
jgi:hypothetical protein